jgi:alkaline phosphatase D
MLRPPQLDYFLQKITRSPRKWKIWGNEVTFMQFKVANTALEPAVAGTTIQSLEELFPGIEDFPAAANLNNPEGVYVTLDQWDGYQAERREITQKIRDDKTFAGPAGVENFITLTGDIHSYIAGYIKFQYDDPSCVGENRPVGVELVCPSVTSSNLSEIATFGFGTAPAPDAGEFGAQVTANNPHIKFFNSNEHGYNVMEVTKDSILCTMFAIRAPVTAENPNGNGIREPNAARTTSEVLRRFRVPDGEVLLIDETNAVPVPLPC